MVVLVPCVSVVRESSRRVSCESHAAMRAKRVRNAPCGRGDVPRGNLGGQHGSHKDPGQQSSTVRQQSH
eukprot:4108580-Prymnesium_polylepis.1